VLAASLRNAFSPSQKQSALQSLPTSSVGRVSTLAKQSVYTLYRV